MKRALIGLSILVALLGRADTLFPGENWQEQPDPLASAHAMVGGEIVDYAGQSPKSLNYYLDNNVFSARVFSSMYETLVDMHPITLEYVPGLARKWSISDDKKTFTFWLDPRATWSDGRSITAADVRWTYEAIMDEKNMTGSHKVSLERLEPPTVLDERTIVFRAKEVHWQNLGAAGGFHILPRHGYAGQDFNRINFEFPIVSGPYRLGRLEEGLHLTLERRGDWWRAGLPSTRGIGNFQTIRYRFFDDRANAFEAFRKGQIDVFAVYTARLWVNETQGEAFAKNWIVKQRIYNQHPIGFQGFAMNMRHPPFDDLRVRKAMAHLIDRDTMNSRLMYDQYFLHRSYYEDLYDQEHPCPNPVTPFDKAEARRLLDEAGWRVNSNTGIREKDGRRFSFKFLTRDVSTERFLAIFTEDLKDVGVELLIDKKDWAAWAKDMDEFHYDMTWAAWGAGVFKNPESMWHSKEADRRGGNNITGFKDARVDVLVEQQKSIFDVQERHEICREIDRIVFEQVPYALLWNINYVRLLYWNKFGMPDTVLSKYGTESTAYWWFDPDAAAELQHSMQTGVALPRRPEKVVFDEVFEDATPASLVTGRAESAPVALAVEATAPALQAKPIPAAERRQDQATGTSPAGRACPLIGCSPRRAFYGLFGLVLLLMTFFAAGRLFRGSAARAARPADAEQENSKNSAESSDEEG